MKLYFVRHGKASQLAESDELRPLTPDGVESVKHIATVLQKAGCQLTKLYTSPRLRARQTADIIGAALGIQPEINDACNFSFSTKAAFALCAGLDDDAGVMFVGHNPSMSEVVENITGATVEMSTGAIACVTRIEGFSTKNAILKWFITPKLIDPQFTGDD